MTTRPRPLSPHLSIYRFTLTMTMSIVHRITGIGLYAGTLLLIAWVGSAAMGEGALATVQGLFGSWFGQFVLFCYTWALFHHCAGGIKHFIWDTTRMMDRPEREWVVWANLLAPAALTLIVWSIFVWFR